MYTICRGKCPSFACATSSSLFMLTVGLASKMAPQQEKVFCVLHFEVSRSVITVQLEFRAARFRKDAPESLSLLRRHLGNRPRSPAVSTSERTPGSAWETWTVAAANGVRFARVRWEINFLLTSETTPFICKHPVHLSINGKIYIEAFLALRAGCL